MTNPACKLIAVAIALGSVTSSCGPSRDTPQPAAKPIVAAEVGLPDSALAIVREVAAGPVTELLPYDSNGDLMPPRGVLFGVAHKQVKSKIARLRERLGAGYLVFEAQRGYGFSPDSIGVVGSSDRFDILRVRSTDGINYDITRDSVMALVRGWDAQFGLEFTGAARDWFEAKFIRPPADWLAFAAALYKVCPDIVDQGTNTVTALADEMRKTNVLFCWWD